MKHTLTLFALALSLELFAQSPYISQVWEYMPAPGQFVNVLPEYEEGDNADIMRQKAQEAIADNNQGLITLGGWGGYVVFGFDHMVTNVSDKCDFVVYGNAFYSGSSDPTAKLAGSCEPGIIQVSYDANGNGEPDDAWYELAGSAHDSTATWHQYELTYFRPSSEHVATPSTTNKALIDTSYIHWKDNYSNNGYMYQISFHTQSYFPQWIEKDSLVFNGTRLPDNNADISGKGTNYILYAYDWGYADNHPNNSPNAELDIDWAVNEDGTPAHLPGIHFVKVYTGVHQQCGWIGETSTEITGAEDINMVFDGINYANFEENETEAYYTLLGSYIGTRRPNAQGTYIVRKGQHTYKIILK